MDNIIVLLRSLHLHENAFMKQKIITSWKIKTKKEYYSNTKKKKPDDEETKEADTIKENNNPEKGKDLTLIYIQPDVRIIVDIFENFFGTCWEDEKKNPTFFVSSTRYISNTGLKYTKIELQNIKAAGVHLILENAKIDAKSICMEKKYVVSVSDLKKLDIDSKNLHGFGMSQSMPYAEIKFGFKIN